MENAIKQTSSLISEAVVNAAVHGINLSAGSPTRADGNCIFSAVIANINSRDCFSSKIDLSPSEARGICLNSSQDKVRKFTGVNTQEFDTQWDILKQDKMYETNMGDFVLPAIAHTLKYDILIF